MISPSQLSGWAGRILEGLGDTVTSTGLVVTWLQYNLPKLNLAIDSSFILNSSGHIDPDMNMSQSGIYEEIHYCDYLRKKSSQLLGGTSFQDVVEFKGNEQGSVKFASFSERAKAYRTLAKDCNENVSQLIDWYIQSTGNYAAQILFNARDAPNTYGLKFSPPDNYYHPNNSIWSRPPTTSY